VKLINLKLTITQKLKGRQVNWYKSHCRTGRAPFSPGKRGCSSTPWWAGALLQPGFLPHVNHRYHWNRQKIKRKSLKQR